MAGTRGLLGQNERPSLVKTRRFEDPYNGLESTSVHILAVILLPCSSKMIQRPQRRGMRHDLDDQFGPLRAMAPSHGL